MLTEHSQLKHILYKFRLPQLFQYQFFLFWSFSIVDRFILRCYGMVISLKECRSVRFTFYSMQYAIKHVLRTLLTILKLVSQIFQIIWSCYLKYDGFQKKKYFVIIAQLRTFSCPLYSRLQIEYFNNIQNEQRKYEKTCNRC